MIRAVAIAALALAGASCGRVGLDRADDGAAGGGLPDARDATGGDAAADVPPAGPPFAVTLRLTNVGASDFRLFLRPSGCFDDLLIQGGAPFDQPTSVQEQDTSCDCTDCSATGGRPRCAVTDFICDEPPIVLAPGAHFDYGWDGIAQVWLPAPPVGSSCVGRCSARVTATAGIYTFTLQSIRAYSVQSPLPAPGGIVEIPVQP